MLAIAFSDRNERLMPTPRKSLTSYHRSYKPTRARLVRRDHENR